jgi:hypothetical protein
MARRMTASETFLVNRRDTRRHGSPLNLSTRHVDRDDASAKAARNEVVTDLRTDAAPVAAGADDGNDVGLKER